MTIGGGEIMRYLNLQPGSVPTGGSFSAVL